ncbi:MAG: RecX family transcriptional regulator [Acidobacteriota bacterium]|nr:RecX family transcriptional regulator [Acidobacteriota bacterium]MDH3784225.1 RecX family transcriptional regulator [Acidobacteriota bacterium]
MPDARRKPSDRSTRDPFVALVRAVGYRPLTALEASARLGKLGFDSDQVDAAIARGRDERILDDGKLAEDYLVLRAERRLEGPRRLIRELVGRGVDESLCESAWQRLVALGDVDEDALLTRRLDRLLAAPRSNTSNERRRVYNALLRAGFEPSAARDAVIKRDIR